MLERDRSVRRCENCWFNSKNLLLRNQHQSAFVCFFHWIFVVVFIGAAAAVRIASVSSLSRIKFTSWHFAHVIMTFDLTLDGRKFATTIYYGTKRTTTAETDRSRAINSQTPFNGQVCKELVKFWRRSSKWVKDAKTHYSFSCFEYLLHLFDLFDHTAKQDQNAWAIIANEKKNRKNDTNRNKWGDFRCTKDFLSTKRVFWVWISHIA